MKRFITYLFLELKKSIKVLGKSVIGMLVMVIFLAAGVTAVSYGLLQSQVFQKVCVAVTIPESESEMRIVTQYVSNMDSVKSICEFVYLEEDEAWAEFERGNVQAVIAFPENFFYDVYVGENPPANIYFADSDATNVMVFKELLKTGISYLQISESGVYASLAMAREHETIVERGSLGDYVAGLYAGQILKRGRTFEKEVISPFGTFQYEEYFFVAALLIILLMSGLQFGYLYRSRNRIISQKLKMEGIGPIAVSIVRIIVMALILWLVALIVYGVTGVASDIMDYEFIYMKVTAVPGLFLLCISLATYFHAVYAISGDSMNGTLFILMGNIIMIMCSGVLIPASYLPEIAVKIGGFLPLSLWNQYCNHLLFGTTVLVPSFQMAGISIIGAGIGAMALWKNT